MTYQGNAGGSRAPPYWIGLAGARGRACFNSSKVSARRVASHDGCSAVVLVYCDSCTLSSTGGLKLIDEDPMLVFASCSGCSRMLDMRRTTRGEGGAWVVEVICTALYAGLYSSCFRTRG